MSLHVGKHLSQYDVFWRVTLLLGGFFGWSDGARYQLGGRGRDDKLIAHCERASHK
jgi:hypothetical protein